eukprot:765157-Hanusia_phi.AAC.4
MITPTTVKDPVQPHPSQRHYHLHPTHKTYTYFSTNSITHPWRYRSTAPISMTLPQFVYNPTLSLTRNFFIWTPVENVPTHYFQVPYPLGPCTLPHARAVRRFQRQGWRATEEGQTERSMNGEDAMVDRMPR